MLEVDGESGIVTASCQGSPGVQRTLGCSPSADHEGEICSRFVWVGLLGEE